MPMQSNLLAGVVDLYALSQGMRERGELRLSRQAKWEKFFERYPDARP